MYSPGLAYNIFQQLIWGKLQHFESEVALIETLVLVFLRLCTADKDTSEGLRQSSSLFESLCGAKQKIVGLGFEASQAARVVKAMWYNTDVDILQTDLL